MWDHHSLGLSSRAGGVHNVGEIFRGDLSRKVFGTFVLKDAPIGSQANRCGMTGRQSVRELRLR